MRVTIKEAEKKLPSTDEADQVGHAHYLQYQS
jgi:hypothetical protein